MKGIIVILTCALFIFAYFVYEALKNLPRFHKGQKVKVKERLNNTSDLYLQMYGGEILTIREIVTIGRPHSYLVYENDLIWAEEMFDTTYKDNKDKTK